MVSRLGVAGIVASLCGFVPLCSAEDLIFHGKVTIENGSIPGRAVSIQRSCGDIPETVGATNAKGEYLLRAGIDASSGRLMISNSLLGGGGLTDATLPNSFCVIRAVLAGYQSSVIVIDDLHAFSNPTLPALVLERNGSQVNFDTYSAAVPRAAVAPWSRADKEIHKKNWSEAERQLQAALKAAPKFALGWQTLGDVMQMAQRPKDAEAAYQQAVAINPRLIPPHLMLARLQIAARDWEGTAKTAEGLLKADTRRQYPEGYVYQAIARYELKDLDGAAASAEEAIRIDKKHDVPLAEYVYGLILEARRELTAANEHMSRFLEIAPKAPEAAAARTRIGNLGNPNAPEAGSEMEAMGANMKLGRPSQAWVPGGIAALAAVARLSSVPSPQDFFAEFCRAVAREGSLGTSLGIPQYRATLQAFMTTIVALTRMGENHGDSTTIRLSLATPEDQDRTGRIFELVGWKLTHSGSAVRVEPSDQAPDSMLQRVLPALDVDEIAMQKSLEDGKPFSFEIPSADARLIGGDGWLEILKDRSMAGGIAAAFATDVRLAEAYVALAAMSPDAASAVASGVGLRDLVTRDNLAAYRYGDVFDVVDQSVATPGGKQHEAVWQKLTGAKPQNPPAFFKALLEKDQGRLAAFYWAMAHADAAHQNFVLTHADSFYPWYRGAGERGSQATEWQTRLLQNVPLEGGGNVRFPGGRSAWSGSAVADAEGLLGLDALQALVPVAGLENKRKAPLDAASAKLLGRHYAEWRALFPLFERLPELTGDDFAALERFGDATRNLPLPQRNIVMAEWHSLVELMQRGMDAGQGIGVRMFRDICTGLALPDPSPRAMELLRTMAGEGDLDQVVPARFLLLSGDRRAAFDRVVALQKVPRLSSAKGGPATAAALSGLVYAASLDADGLLINEDPQLLTKHRFAAAGLFDEPALVRSSQASGSYLTGGLMNFAAFAKSFANGGKSVDPAAVHAGTTDVAAGPDVAADSVGPDTIFRAESRLVEVYATVMDSSGHYVDDLSRDRFKILDQGKQPKIVAFEPRSAEVSVALLLDTTASMQGALPALKNAALRLIGDLRPADAIAVYSFSDSVRELQPFTTEKDPAKRAVLRTQAFGDTALYDALTRVGRDLAGRSGKKVIVLFTDGNDNSSTLTADTAVLRAKAAGVPVYTVAQGQALLHPALITQLATVSKATGAESFVIRQPHEIHAVFDKISEELTHGYLLVFQPDPTQDHSWRSIEVGLQGVRGGRVKAREGYYP